MQSHNGLRFNGSGEAAGSWARLGSAGLGSSSGTAVLTINYPYKGAGVPHPAPVHAPRLTEPHTATGGYMFIDQTHM